MVVIRPVFESGHVLFFLEHQWLSDIVHVNGEESSFHQFVEVLEVLFELHQWLLLESIGLNLNFASVDEAGLLEEEAVEASDDGSWREMKLHLLSFIKLISAKNGALLDKGNLEDFIKFVMKRVSWMVLSWLKILEKLDHVFGILFVDPFVNATLSLLDLWELKEFPESFDKGPVEEALVDLNLDVLWKLLDVSHVFFGLMPGHLVVCPVELEEVFKLVLELLVD